MRFGIDSDFFSFYNEFDLLDKTSLGGGVFSFLI